MNIVEKSFNPSDHLMNVGTQKKPRWYLEVKWRLVWLREQCPEATITTELIHLDLDKEVTATVKEWDDGQQKMVWVTKKGTGLAIYKATVKLPNGASATGTKMENAASFGDFLEKAETGAIGRALAGLGFGTQFTGDELNEGQRIVDAPVEGRSKTSNSNNDADKAARDAELVAKAAQSAKAKAIEKGIINDDEGWKGILKSAGLEAIKTGKDMAMINKALADFEKTLKAS